MFHGFKVIGVSIIGGQYLELMFPGPISVQMTHDAAIELAAYLVFMANGSLLKCTKNGVVEEWYTDRPFFQKYAELCGHKLKG